MSEYIDRKAFLNDAEARYCLPCKGAGKDYNGVKCRACWVDDMMGDVEDAPAADVAPVVRCKDCRHYKELRTKRHKQVVRLCYRMGKYDMEYHVNPDDFCSRGERAANEAVNGNCGIKLFEKQDETNEGGHER